MKTQSPRVNSTKVGNIVNQGGAPTVLMSFELQQMLIGLGANPNNTVVNVPVGGSPFTFANTGEFPATIIVSGGTVSDVAFSRDGVNFFSFATSAPASFNVNPADMIRVTYSSIPLLTLIPR